MDTPPTDSRTDALLAAAAHVFAEKGYHSTPMRNPEAAPRMSWADLQRKKEGTDMASVPRSTGRSIAHGKHRRT